MDYRRILEYAIGVPFTDGNSVIRYRNGQQIFPAMLAAVEGARSQIDFLTYIYWRGDIAEAFAAALAARARAGVQVRVV
ncbi:MAG: cardiolipin synthase B, partial [Pseudomonadota bacterium]